jgi:hypothetical protein
VVVLVAVEGLSLQVFILLSEQKAPEHIGKEKI